jgi:aspartate 1-decarboxylase
MADDVYRKMLSAKIHRAIVTHANKEYEGSLTIPPELLRRTGIREHEAVNVWNVTRGTRFETYAITGVEGTGDVCVNGAAAHLAEPGDRIIIATFADVPESRIDSFHPVVVFVDDHNLAIRAGVEKPGPHLRGDGC